MASAKVIGAVPLGRWETITFVAALRHNKMVAPMVVEGAMTGEMFLAYVENCLVPTLRRNDIVVMDELPGPIGTGIGRAIETVGADTALPAEIFARPQPSIEMPYSKFKTFLRKVAARTIPSLNRAIRSFIPQPVLKNVPTISGMQAMFQYDRISALVGSSIGKIAAIGWGGYLNFPTRASAFSVAFEVGAGSVIAPSHHSSQGGFTLGEAPARATRRELDRGWDTSGPDVPIDRRRVQRLGPSKEDLDGLAVEEGYPAHTDAGRAEELRSEFLVHCCVSNHPQRCGRGSSVAPR